jgi:large subunit ribosomal protein L18
MIRKDRAEKRERLKRHIRLTISGTPERPRLTVFRSARHLYTQIIDDSTGRTLVAASDLAKAFKEEFQNPGSKKELGHKLGLLTARMAKEKNITRVVFDRNGYLYHGVVKAVGEGAREGGLQF